MKASIGTQEAIFDLDVLTETPEWLAKLPNVVELCRSAACAAFTAGRQRSYPGVAFEACLLLTDDARVKALNKDYRGRDEPTNVLAFPNAEVDVLAAIGADGPPSVLGDIVIALETTTVEAALESKSLGDHLRHLVVHGTLHLLGYDHASPSEAADMEELEVRVLETLGVANPYSLDGEH